MHNCSEIIDKYIKDNSMDNLTMSNAIEIRQNKSLSVNKNYSGYKKILHCVSQMLINYKLINFIDIGLLME